MWSTLNLDDWSQRKIITETPQVSHYRSGIGKDLDEMSSVFFHMDLDLYPPIFHILYIWEVVQLLRGAPRPQLIDDLTSEVFLSLISLVL